MAIFAVCFCVVRMVYNYMLLYDVIYGFINHEAILVFLPVAVAMAIPVLTFSMYESERKKDVMSFLRSLPLRSGDVIFGKYLSRLVVLVGVYIVTVLIDIILGFYSGSHILTVVYSSVCYLLISVCVLSVNVFLASVCKNRFVALGIGYGVAVILTVLTALRYFVPHTLLEIMTPISLFGTYVSAVFGMVDIASLFMWLTVSGLFIYLSYIFVKKEIRL